eukprot:6189246-Pleurochrysis_carterae.AAC.1
MTPAKGTIRSLARIKIHTAAARRVQFPCQIACSAMMHSGLSEANGHRTSVATTVGQVDLRPRRGLEVSLFGWIGAGYLESASASAALASPVVWTARRRGIITAGG